MKTDLLAIAKQAEADARDEVTRLHSENDSQTRRVADLDQEITQKLRTIAEAMVTERRDIPPVAVSLMNDRDARVQALRQEISGYEADLVEEKKNAEAAENDLAQARASAQAALLANPTYLALVDQKVKVGDARDLAVANIDAIGAECAEKRVAYEDHPFYHYLIDAKFGTSEYKRKGFTRAIDTWLAKWCNFDVNRRNEVILISMAEECASTQEALKIQHSDIDTQLAELTKDVEDRFNVSALERACGAVNSAGSDKVSAALARALGLTDERKRLQAAIAQRWEEMNQFIALEDSFFKEAVETTFSDLLLSSMDDVARRVEKVTPVRLGYMAESLKGLGAEREKLLGLIEQRASRLEEAGNRLDRAVQLKNRAKMAARAESRSGPSVVQHRSMAAERWQDNPREDRSDMHVNNIYVAGMGGSSDTAHQTQYNVREACREDRTTERGSRIDPVCSPKEREPVTDREASYEAPDTDTDSGSGDSSGD